MSRSITPGRFGTGLRTPGTTEGSKVVTEGPKVVTEVSLRAHGTLKGFGPRVEEEERPQGGAVPGFAPDTEAEAIDILCSGIGPECTRRIPRAFGAKALGAKGATWIGAENMEENVSCLITGFGPCTVLAIGRSWDCADDAGCERGIFLDS